MSKRILVVEDDPAFVRILTRLLDPWSPDVTVTELASEGRRLLETRAFDLALIDVRLRRDDGLSLLDFIDSRPGSLQSRCVVVTSYPTIGRAFTKVPVVNKTRLVDLGAHLLRILGTPPRPAGREEGAA